MAWADHEWGRKNRKEADRHHRNRVKLARRYNCEEECAVPFYPESMADLPVLPESDPVPGNVPAPQVEASDVAPGTDINPDPTADIHSPAVADVIDGPSPAHPVENPPPADPGHALSEPRIVVADPHAADATSPTAAEVAQANLEEKEANAPDELDAALAEARKAQQDAIQAKADHDAAVAEAEKAYQDAVDEANAALAEAVAADEAEDVIPPEPAPVPVPEPAPETPPTPEPEPAPAPVPEPPAAVSEEDQSQDARLSALEAAEQAEQGPPTEPSA